MPITCRNMAEKWLSESLAWRASSATVKRWDGRCAIVFAMSEIFASAFRVGLLPADCIAHARFLRRYSFIVIPKCFRKRFLG